MQKPIAYQAQCRVFGDAAAVVDGVVPPLSSTPQAAHLGIDAESSLERVHPEGALTELYLLYVAMAVEADVLVERSAGVAAGV